MQVSVKGRHLEVSEPLRAYAERRLRFAIGEFETRVGAVAVRLADVNGPRGGIDKTCAVSVTLQPSGRVSARALDGNAYSAVDRAAARIRSVLVRRLRRQGERQRRGADPQEAAERYRRPAVS